MITRIKLAMKIIVSLGAVILFALAFNSCASGPAQTTASTVELQRIPSERITIESFLDKNGDPIANKDSLINGQYEHHVKIGGGATAHDENYGVDVPATIKISFNAPIKIDAITIVSDWYNKIPKSGEIEVWTDGGWDSVYEFTLQGGRGSDCGDGEKTFGDVKCQYPEAEWGFKKMERLDLPETQSIQIIIKSLYDDWYAAIAELEFYVGN